MNNKWYKLAGLVLIVLACVDFVEMAYATTNNSGPKRGSDASRATSESTSQAASLSTSKSMATGGSAVAAGGEAFAKGGASTSISGDSMATGGAGGTSSAEGASVGDISIGGDSNPRQAPGAVAIPPQTTAECMVGIGFAGSNKTGAVALSPSWMQKDCWAMKQFELLASLGLHQAASKSYCSRKINWFSFESKEKCEALITQSLILIAVDAEEIASVKKQLPKVTPIQGWLSRKSKKSLPMK